MVMIIKIIIKKNENGISIKLQTKKKYIIHRIHRKKLTIKTVIEIAAV